MGSKSLISDLRAFIAALSKDWIAAASGGVGLIFTIVGPFLPTLGWQTSLLILAGLAFAAAAFRVWRREHEAVLSLLSKVDGRGRLQVEFNKGVRRYDEVHSYMIHGSRRSLSIAIRNVGSAKLTDVTLWFLSITPDEGRLPTELQMPLAFSNLNPGECGFREVVTLVKNGPAAEDMNDTMATLHVPYTFDAVSSERAIDANGDYVVTLRATAAECEPCLALLRIFISPDNRLQLLHQAN